MKIVTSQVTKHRITDIENLDPLTVIAENFGPGSGKIIIECFGESWAHFWSHMGEQYTLETFFLRASDCYIAGKLCRGREDETDWDGFPDRIRKEVIRMRKDGEITKKKAREYYDEASSVGSEIDAGFQSEFLSEVLGGDWFMELSTKPTREYKYLMRIIPVVKQAFADITQRQSA